ncbi:MAG TPA: DUF1674 domain-containing protein [Asticcacaulis sp.]|nr:DUF1674 domain-containing protein [Asticcacaulis sp.]
MSFSVEDSGETEKPADLSQVKKKLTPEAERALAEAAERRAKAEAEAAEQAPEDGGPSGPEPTRYGDWERKGLAVDF